MNISGREDIVYFNDGITKEIIKAPSQIEPLKVTSRTSAYYYKIKNIPVKGNAKNLNMTTVSESSVRLASNSVRITAQPIHAKEYYYS